jgi:hypothetical protein
MKWSVARPGFEPRQTESKSVVLPLYYRAILKMECKNKGDVKMFQMFLANAGEYAALRLKTR